MHQINRRARINHVRLGCLWLVLLARRAVWAWEMVAWLAGGVARWWGGSLVAWLAGGVAGFCELRSVLDNLFWVAGVEPGMTNKRPA
jgi:hypothetical protein